MTYLKKLVLADEYRGEHEAPGKDGDDAPLHDLKGIYPDDFYEGKASQYAGDEPGANECVGIMLSCKGRPKRSVKIYRAVPKKKTVEMEIAEYEKAMYEWKRRNKMILNVNIPKADYYDYVANKLEELKAKPPEEPEAKLKINKGDWVTLSRTYAVEHGKDNLNNMYRILSKTVPASTLWTDGNSVCEWGYDP